MKVLAFEASAKVAGVAVRDDDRLLGEIYADSGLTHSETLLPMCDELLRKLHLSLQDMDLFAVSAGPGSFTGLRIAVASLKGMMLGCGKKCAPVSTLLALAENVSCFDGIICASMDAKCQQVYNAIFSCEKGKLTRLCKDRALSLSELKEDLKKYSEKSIILVGDGAELCYNTCLEMSNCILAPVALRYERASSVAFSAKEEDAVDEQELHVIYLRLAQAERERLAKEEEAK